VTLAYTFDGVSDQPGTGADLYAQYAVVRKWYDQVEKWTGFDTERIFNAPAVTREGGFRWEMAPIRQAAAAIATCDVLADYGLLPGLVGGMSLGALISSCVAGAIDRRDLIELLMRMRDVPPPPEPPQGMAMLVLGADGDVSTYLREGLYLVGEAGPAGPGGHELYILGGYRSVIDELSGELPPGLLTVFDEIPVARHTPLLQYVADYMEPYVLATSFRDPRVPLVAAIDPKTITTAEEVRDVFLRHHTSPLHLQYLTGAFEQHDAELILLIGPSRVGKFQTPVPSIHIQTPEHVLEAVTAAHELGVRLPATGSVR
jgi:[acyl-carrier-protein] S-malonyltransferase